MACGSQPHTIMMAYLLMAILVVGYPLSVWWLWRQMHYDLPDVGVADRNGSHTVRDASAPTHPTTGSGLQRATGHRSDLAYPPWVEAPFLSPTGRLLAVAPVRSR